MKSFIQSKIISILKNGFNYKGNCMNNPENFSNDDLVLCCFLYCSIDNKGVVALIRFPWPDSLVSRVCSMVAHTRSKASLIKRCNRSVRLIRR